MNKLKAERQSAIIAALVEGNSIRSIERMTGVHRDTICRLLVRVGDGVVSGSWKRLCGVSTAVESK